MTDITFSTRDEFDRKPIAEKIYTLLKSPIEVSPLVIDGGWGTGKTEFCKKLISLIETEEQEKKSKIECVYIDAFKADHANAPLMTVIAAIAEKFSASKQKTLIEKAGPALRHFSKLVLKGGLSYLVKQDVGEVVDDFDAEVNKAGAKIIDKAVDRALKDHINAEKNLSTLQEALRELSKENPLIVFIDELDRCRPNFAVDMLELIKHTLEVEGIQFVFVNNMNQMRASVRHCYGSDVDAQRYLDKFVKFTIGLPQITDSTRPFTSHVSKLHCRQLLKEGGLELNSHDSTIAIGKFLDRLIDVKNLSLREIETVVRHIQIYNTLTRQGKLPSGHFFTDYFAITGIVAYSVRPELAEGIYNDKIDIQSFFDFVSFNNNYESGPGERLPDPVEILCFCVSDEALDASGNRALMDKYRLKGQKREMFKIKANKSFEGSWAFDETCRRKIIADAIGTLKLASG